MPRERLSATGRFTTTGVFGRLLDAGLRASLLLRGKVPAGLAAAAETTYREQLDADRFTYYGRVVRDGGYICLQYWFFYAMNDWRSTFGGINDHEADWEMVTIYLAERADGPPQPAWVAFSSHDYHGDDLRRRWDDPELQPRGRAAGRVRRRRLALRRLHPRGITSSRSTLPSPGRRCDSSGRLQRLLAPWRHYTGSSAGPRHPIRRLRPGRRHRHRPRARPSVDPGSDRRRHAMGTDYRGLWGLDTRDRFGGERAPSGPRYERNGSVRTSWSNPLGWAGLLKIPPHDHDLAHALEQRIAELDRTARRARRHDRGRPRRSPQPARPGPVAARPRLRPSARNAADGRSSPARDGTE